MRLLFSRETAPQTPYAALPNFPGHQIRFLQLRRTPVRDNASFFPVRYSSYKPALQPPAHPLVVIGLQAGPAIPVPGPGAKWAINRTLPPVVKCRYIMGFFKGCCIGLFFKPGKTFRNISLQFGFKASQGMATQSRPSRIMRQMRWKAVKHITPGLKHLPVIGTDLGAKLLIRAHSFKQAARIIRIVKRRLNQLVLRMGPDGSRRPPAIGFPFLTCQCLPRPQEQDHE